MWSEWVGHGGLNGSFECAPDDEHLRYHVDYDDDDDATNGDDYGDGGIFDVQRIVHVDDGDGFLFLQQMTHYYQLTFPCQTIKYQIEKLRKSKEEAFMRI